MLRLLVRKSVRADKGFTLLELLVVVVIIAILVSIAIAFFPYQRAKAHDSEAKALIRGAMNTIESAFVDTETFDPTVDGMLPVDLRAIEPSINFVVLVDSATAPTARASKDSVNYSGSAKTYAVGTVSESGTTFGVVVDKAAGTTYYVAGEPADW
jgi:prepilin-type N-terminal cleavage/methylation domain-containing protein